MTPHKPTGGRPEDIPESVWDVADGFARAEGQGSRTELVARAILAERARWQPAVDYFNTYCRDEAEDPRACVCGEEQHEAARAFASAICGGE